jgi:hypothetical protein
MSDILDKARRALVAYTAGVTANVYDAKRSGDKNAPSLTWDMLSPREDPPFSGNFFMEAEGTLRTMAPQDADGVDPRPGSDALTAALIALLEIDNDSLRTALSAQIAGFTVMGFGEEKTMEQIVDGDAWVFVWRRTIYCAGF